MTSVTGVLRNKPGRQLLLPPPPSSTTSRLPHRSVGVVQEEEKTSPPHPSCAVEERMLAKDHQMPTCKMQEARTRERAEKEETRAELVPMAAAVERFL